MCGISLAIGNQGTKENVNLMLSAIKHRGDPEHFGNSISFPQASLGMNRLAIVDREAATQPVMTPDGRYCLVFNGEIYNHNDLRERLINLGHKFTTNGDAEVLAQSFQEWGKGCLDHLRGMFAFAIYDKREQEVFIARDPFGIKPLYFVNDSNNLFASSEIKSLSCLPDTGKIEVLPPGSYYLAHQIYSYFDPSTIKTKEDSREAFQSSLLDLFDSAVKSRVQTDLKVGVFFSGGLDSTAVLEAANRHHSNITALITGTEDSSDRLTAVRYCEECDIPYEILPTPSENELKELIPELVRITESFEPNMIRQSAVSYHLSRFAKDLGFKIVLCGEGADELFAGYPELSAIDDDEVLSQQILSFVQDLHRTQLQRVDRTAMAATVEVRVPFLDFDFACEALRCPAEFKRKKIGDSVVSKHILRQALSKRLPDYISDRPKVVLSEGAGLGGNDLNRGMFSGSFSWSDIEPISEEEKQQWSINNPEEAYYFKLFQSYGYDRAIFNQERTNVNRTKTL